MSFIGTYKYNNGHKLIIERDNNTIEIDFDPQTSVKNELYNGDRIEIRLHRDIRNDSTVLYAGNYFMLSNDKISEHWLREKARENLDGTANCMTEHSLDEIYKDIHPRPNIYEYLEIRLHRLEKANDS